MKNIQSRKEQYNLISNKLSCMSDVNILNLLSNWKAGPQGIGGVSILGEIDDIPVFVKRIPLTSIETNSKNYRNTANIFNLPLYYKYGIGSLGFGAWRELAAHVITSNWDLTDLCPNFPIMYHFRILPDIKLSESHDWADARDLYVTATSGSKEYSDAYITKQSPRACRVVIKGCSATSVNRKKQKLY